MHCRELNNPITGNRYSSWAEWPVTPGWQRSERRAGRSALLAWAPRAAARNQPSTKRHFPKLRSWLGSTTGAPTEGINSPWSFLTHFAASAAHLRREGTNPSALLQSSSASLCKGGQKAAFTLLSFQRSPERQVTSCTYESLSFK